jgi:hypothetical protein
LPAGLPHHLPATAAAILASAYDEQLSARLQFLRPVGDHLLVLVVIEPAPPPWPTPVLPTRPQRAPTAVADPVANPGRSSAPAGRTPSGVRCEIFNAIDALNTRSGTSVLPSETSWPNSNDAVPDTHCRPLPPCSRRTCAWTARVQPSGPIFAASTAASTAGCEQTNRPYRRKRLTR